jgi:RimJ/RimL family protein N-acetyltransferase
MTPRSTRGQWSLRRMEPADLPQLLDVQRRGAVLGLADVFEQTAHPFPAGEIRDRWAAELDDRSIAAYVAGGPDGRLLGFAARRADELLHFGTAPETWGSGLATWLHDALVGTYPPGVRRLRLWVFEGNGRARRLYEKLGWTATGARSRTSYPPHPRLLEYELRTRALEEAVRGVSRSGHVGRRGTGEAGVLGGELGERPEGHESRGHADGGQRGEHFPNHGHRQHPAGPGHAR